MLLYIESFTGDALLHGKAYPEARLQRMVQSVIDRCGAEHFIPCFCTCYDFELYPLDEAMQADFCWDMDIGYLYRPR